MRVESSSARAAAFDPERLHRLTQRAANRPHQSDWRDQRGHVIDAALVVLADGHPRTGDEIWTEARRRRLLAHTQQKDVYIALVAYIERHSGQGRWCTIIQDVDRRFRLNHPLDDWPDPKHPLPVRKPVREIESLRRELEKTQRGPEPTAYELAVCRAFEALGFVVQHVGGNGAPDGVLEARWARLRTARCSTASARNFIGSSIQTPQRLHATASRTGRNTQRWLVPHSSRA